MTTENWDLAEGLRYVLAGLATMVVCWGTYVGLIELANVHYLISANIATLVAWGFAYLVHRRFVFRSQTSHLRSGSRFVILQLSLLVFANLVLYLEVSILQIHYFVSVVLMSIVVAALNFVLMKLLVFSPAGSPDSKTQVR